MGLSVSDINGEILLPLNAEEALRMRMRKLIYEKVLIGLWYINLK